MRKLIAGIMVMLMLVVTGCASTEPFEEQIRVLTWKLDAAEEAAELAAVDLKLAEREALLPTESFVDVSGRAGSRSTWDLEAVEATRPILKTLSNVLARYAEDKVRKDVAELLRGSTLAD